MQTMKENACPHVGQPAGPLKDVTALLSMTKGRDKVEAELVQLGARVLSRLTGSVTHLILGKDGDAHTYRAARQQEGVLIVNPGWVLTCATIEEHVDCTPFLSSGCPDPPPAPPPPPRRSMDPSPPVYAPEPESSSQRFPETSRHRHGGSPAGSESLASTEVASNLTAVASSLAAPPAPAPEEEPRWLTDAQATLEGSGGAPPPEEAEAAAEAAEAEAVEVGKSGKGRSKSKGKRVVAETPAEEEGAAEADAAAAPRRTRASVAMPSKRQMLSYLTEKGHPLPENRGMGAVRKVYLSCVELDERRLGGEDTPVPSSDGKTRRVSFAEEDGGEREAEEGEAEGSGRRTKPREQKKRRREGSVEVQGGEGTQLDGAEKRSAGEEAEKASHPATKKVSKKRLRPAREADAAAEEPEGKRKASPKRRAAAEAPPPVQLALSLSTEPELKLTVLAAVHELGGCTMKPDEAEVPSEHVSHLIVASESPTRTVKILFAMARGIPIVRAEWVLRSVEAGHWISPMPFIALPPSATPRQQLTGKVFCVESSQKLQRPTLERLIVAAGGEVVCWRRAKLIVGSARVPEGGKPCSEAWVLDRVMTAGAASGGSQRSTGSTAESDERQPAEEAAESESEEF